MAQNKLSDLRNHLFETIEMLKNNSDPKADENEKIDIQTAKQISSVASDIIESYKVELQGIEILSKAQNPDFTSKFLIESGVFNTNMDMKQLNQ